METKVEGILISKHPFGERHLNCKILLRTGKEISMTFYGGRGGGTKKKSSILEVGHMLSIEVKKNKKETDVYHAKEWKLLWGHQFLRDNHLAYYTLCLFIEIVSKIAPKDDLSDSFRNDDLSSEGLFRVLSNALVFLDQSVKEKTFNQYWHILVFLTKLSHEQGIFPQRELCHYSDTPLLGSEQLILIPEHGSFALSHFVKDQFYSPEEVNQGTDLWRLLDEIMVHRYGKSLQQEVSPNLVKSYLSYVCYQYNLQQKQFKTIRMIWF